LEGERAGIVDETRSDRGKRRITELHAELITERNKLKALVELGTPFAQYQNAVLSAEGFIPGFIQKVAQEPHRTSATEHVRNFEPIQTSQDLDRCGETTFVLVELDLLRFHPRLSALRESQITATEVSRQHDVAVKTLEDLRDLIHQSSA
jgi:hypothetical protein